MKKSAIKLTVLLLALLPIMFLNSCQEEQEMEVQEEIVSLKAGELEGEMVTYWGDETFTREDGKPKVVTMKIGSEDLQHFEDCFILKIKNGNEDGTNRVSSATIKVDGKEIFGTDEFNLEVGSLEKEICGLTEESEIEVELRSEVGSFLNILLNGNLLAGHAQLNPEGGLISILDGEIKIELPKDAIEERTYIIIKNVSEELPVEFRPDDYVQYELLPHGLTFKKPVIFTVPYIAENDKLNLPVAAFSISDAIWEEIEILNVDKLNKKVQLSVNHFSIWLIQVQDFYLVVDIPGKYLKKSDLLYCLALMEGSESFTWFPGHVGVYLGTNDKNDKETNDGSTIIESIPGGVGFSTLESGFINPYYHIYMGPRRYIGNISGEQRQSIAEYAINQNGKEYSLVGQGNWSGNKFSCVGLAEASYDHNDLSIVPKAVEIPFLYPYDQYKRTKPIDEITLKVGESCNIDVFGVVYDDTEKYIKTSDGVGIYDKPNNANWFEIGDEYRFSWTPSQSDAGKSFDVYFHVTVPVGVGGTELRRQKVKMQVEANNTECIDPDGKSYKTVQIGDQIWMAENYAYLPEVYKKNDASSTSPRYYVYDYDGTIVEDAKLTNNYKTYGALYNYQAAKLSCPEGWHLPSMEEWKELIKHICDKEGYDFNIYYNNWPDVGYHLKSENGWNNNNGNNSYGFNALASGFIYTYSNPESNFFGYQGVYTNFLTSNAEPDGRMIVFGLSCFNNGIHYGTAIHTYNNYSIRYIMDKE